MPSASRPEATVETLKGVRLADGVIAGPAIFRPGAYGRIAEGGAWHGCTPTGLAVNLADHEVVEHEDGTITVSPSILVAQSNVGEWHGYLRAGVWESC